MGRQKPNKPSKSPNKRIEEQDKQDPSTNITPPPATARKNTTETEQSENPQAKPYRAHTPVQDIYANDASMIHHMDKLDQDRKLKGQALYRDDDESFRTVDKFEHVHNTENIMSNPRMGQESSPTQDDHKEVAQDSDASSPSSTTQQKIKHRQRDNAKMEKMCAALADNTKLQLKQQEERHAKEIADKRQANRDAHDLFTTKTTQPQTITMNDHRITAHFNTMTKASDTLFDGTPGNWQIFEHHLLTEAENPTIAWNHHITHFQPDEEEQPDKLLPLPQPPVRARPDARTNPSAQRATQLRRVLARVYDVSIQNQITTTVP
jgi:hypothetical protein